MDFALSISSGQVVAKEVADQTQDEVEHGAS